MEIDPAGAETIAGRARGTPRVANRLLKRVRDFAEVRGSGHIDAEVAAEALDLLEVDAAGLDRLDREILRAVCEKFGGGPVGLGTLAVAVGEEADTIEDVYEPYLLQQGFLMRTPRGRDGDRRRVRPPRPRAAPWRRSAPLLSSRRPCRRRPSERRAGGARRRYGYGSYTCPRRASGRRPYRPSSSAAGPDGATRRWASSRRASSTT